MLPPIDTMTPLLHVFDMSRSVAFYCDVLGFGIVETSGPGSDFFWCRLRLGEAILMLNSAYDEGDRPPTPDALRVAAHCDTVLYFGCTDADAAYAHLCDLGWPAQAPVTAYYGMRQVYTQDPDGFAICFQHPVEH